MRAKFGRGPTFVSKKGSLKFISRFVWSCAAKFSIWLFTSMLLGTVKVDTPCYPIIVSKHCCNGWKELMKHCEVPNRTKKNKKRR